MNWEIVEGKWQQAKGRLLEEWGRLIGDELTVIAGRRTQQAGKLLHRYGIARQDAERQLVRCQRLFVGATRQPVLARSRRVTYRRPV